MQKGKYWDTPLHAAAQQSNTEIVHLLLEFGADINAKNTELLRPVDVASSSSLAERMLLQHEGRAVCEHPSTDASAGNREQGKLEASGSRQSNHVARFGAFCESEHFLT